MRLIDRDLLAAVSAQARVTPRGRKNHNFHPREDYPAHRMLNAMEPGSYVVPHRHLDATKDESIILLQGRLGLLFFDAEGKVTEQVELSPSGPALGIDISHGTYHTALALETGTVFFEAKSGPYLPLAAAEKAPWAPDEGEPGVAAYYACLLALFPVQK